VEKASSNAKSRCIVTSQDWAEAIVELQNSIKQFEAKFTDLLKVKSSKDFLKQDCAKISSMQSCTPPYGKSLFGKCTYITPKKIKEPLTEEEIDAFEITRGGGDLDNINEDAYGSYYPQQSPEDKEQFMKLKLRLRELPQIIRTATREMDCCLSDLKKYNSNNAHQANFLDILRNTFKTFALNSHAPIVVNLDVTNNMKAIKNLLLNDVIPFVRKAYTNYKVFLESFVFGVDNNNLPFYKISTNYSRTSCTLAEQKHCCDVNTRPTECAFLMAPKLVRLEMPLWAFLEYLEEKYPEEHSEFKEKLRRELTDLKQNLMKQINSLTGKIIEKQRADEPKFLLRNKLRYGKYGSMVIKALGPEEKQPDFRR
jgi:hypothetical protein